MKATKKIVGAAVALVAAVALSAGSTFAWFASNNRVTADGMQVKATVPTNIYIAEGYKASYGDGAGFAESVTFSGGVKTLTPAAVSATKNGGSDATITEGSGTATLVEDSTIYLYTCPDVGSTDGWGIDGGQRPTQTTPGTPSKYVYCASGKADLDFAWSDESTIPASTTNINYVATYNMTIANTSTSSISAIDASVVISATSTETCQFLRTGFLVKTASSTNWFSIANSSSGTALGATGGTLDYQDILTTFAADSVVNITFLMWFDGNDTECTVKNATSIQNISAQITFTADSGAGA